MVTIGSRIRVWWTEEEAWFAGRVVSSKRGGVHSVAYDDGVKVTHNLQKEKWEAEQELKRKAPAKADAPTLAKRKKGPPAQEQAADAPPTQSTKTKHQQPAGHSLGAPPDGCECPGPSWA